VNIFLIRNSAQIIEEEKSHLKTGAEGCILEYLRMERIYKRSYLTVEKYATANAMLPVTCCL
jgi:hypothetical protein